MATRDKLSRVEVGSRLRSPLMAENEQHHDLSFIGEKQFQIRRVWNTEREEWFYSITDVIAVLVPDSPDPSGYWRTLKRRLKEEEGFDETASQITQYRLK